MAKKKAATPKSESKPRVLIVYHGSNYTQDIKRMYENHPTITYDITVKTDEAIRNLRSKDPGGNSIKGYDIIDQSGSRRKKNLNDESARWILDNADTETNIINRCYSAQVLANYNGVDVARLNEYQKGKQEIELHQGAEGREKAYIHKAHRWGIPVAEDSESKLELLASSEQVLECGKQKTRIHEIFKSRKNPKHIGIQGHGEQGVGKELMYGILNDIHASGYKGKQ
jgi:GMP synthase-like glutamine amidotransferase